MVITILGVKKSVGKTADGKDYSGYRCNFSYPALDPETKGQEVDKKFISDKVLKGIIPEENDKFELILNFEGRIVSVKPIVEPKGNNYSQPASK